MRRGGFNLIPLAIGAVVVVGMMIKGCEEGPFGRQRVVGLTPQEEVRLGAQAFREVLAKERPLPADSPIVETVRRIGLQLAKASEDPELQKAVQLKKMNFEWEFRVVQSKQINAFCLPGGKVVVYTGILPVCATDAGLATVMGHEIAHALGRHGAERIAQQQMVAVGQTALAVSMNDMDPRQRMTLMALMGVGSQVGILLPFSRSHESEADHLGLLLMAEAGYDPAEAPEFWQRMDRATSRGGRQPEFLSTHPNPTTRVADLRRWQKEAEVFYRKSNRQPSRALPGVSGSPFSRTD
jgi:metalloendopeptidase OMA1, mitochondrial